LLRQLGGQLDRQVAVQHQADIGAAADQSLQAEPAQYAELGQSLGAGGRRVWQLRQQRPFADADAAAEPGSPGGNRSRNPA